MQSNNTLARAFTYGNAPVRTVEIDGETWFVHTDVCAVLGITQPQNFLKSDRCDKDGVCLSYTISDNLGRDREVVVISKPNVYALLARSNRPEAIRFMRWITHEVLPEIEKTGRYMGAPLGISANPMLAALDVIRDSILRQEAMDAELQIVKGDVAEILRKQEEALALPQPLVKAPEMTHKALCIQAIRAYASATGASIQDAWHIAYETYDLTYKVCLTKRAKNGGFQNRLDYLDHSGRITELYAIITRMVEKFRAA